jgi:uncharacterized repeat protein (TIGR01451 family)
VAARCLVAILLLAALAGPGSVHGQTGMAATGDALSAAVQVHKVGPAAVNVGQPLSYEIVLRNTGIEPVVQLRLDEELAASVRLVGAQPEPEVRDRRLSWRIDRLEPGAERRFQVEVLPQTEGDLQSCATVTLSATACTQMRITRPRLSLTKTGPEDVHLDDPAVFQIVVTNIGSGPATNVVLRDELPPGLKHAHGDVIEADVGTLAPGESKTVTLETVAAAVGSHTNEAVVTADGGLQEKARATVRVTQGALALRKEGPTFRYLGREADFDLEVHNPGSAPATRVLLVDTLPEGLEFVAASDGGVYDPAARQVGWMLGTLGAGERRGLSLKLLAVKSGEWINQAEAHADHDLQARAQARLRVEGVAALMLEVVDLDDPVEVGNETTYEIRVLNQGSSPCQALQIVADVPPEMEPLEGSGPTTARQRGQQLVFEPLPRLAARADALYRVRVRARQPGDVRFRVYMTCEQLQRPVLEEESTRIYEDR